MRDRIRFVILMTSVFSGFVLLEDTADAAKKDRLIELYKSATSPTRERMIDHYRAQREGRLKIKDKRRAILLRPINNNKEK